MSLVDEIKRRKVFQVAAVYAVVAWLLIQIVVAVEAPLHLPDWADTLTIVLLAVGFPIALVVSWAFDLTSEGLVRDSGLESRTRGRSIEYVLIGLLVVAVGWFVYRDIRSPGSGEMLANSVAILPFQNLSPDPDNAYIAAGLHEEILNQVGQIRSMNVIQLPSVLPFNMNDLPPIAEIGRTLRVEAVVLGAVRYSDDSVRVTIRMIDTQTSIQLWSQTYERRFDEIFAIESDIAIRVAAALEVQLSPEDLDALESMPTSEPAAYALYLRSRAILSANVSADEAHVLLDRAIDLDPGFANAYALKALVFAASFVNTAQGSGVPEEGRAALDDRARVLAQRALDLDPGNRVARNALRDIYILTWHWTAFEQAVEPGDEITFDGIPFWAYAWMGQLNEGIRLGIRRTVLDPNAAAPHFYLGVLYAYAGDHEASLQSLERAYDFEPDNALLRTWKVYNEVALGNAAAAADELRLLEQSLGDVRPLVFLPELAYSYARIGRADDVARIVEEMESLDTTDQLGAGAWAVTRLAMGDEASALEQLKLVAERARNHELEPGFLNVMNLKMNYLADPVLRQPEFVDVLDRIRGD